MVSIIVKCVIVEASRVERRCLDWKHS